MCKHGTTVPMEIGGRVASIDSCIAPLIASLNCHNNIKTIACCCGHGNRHGNICLELFGKELWLNIHQDYKSWQEAEKKLGGTDIHGIRQGPTFEDGV